MEYWLVVARMKPVSFDILRRTIRGCQAARKQTGWTRTVVFGMSFRLIPGLVSRKQPTLTLEVQ